MNILSGDKNKAAANALRDRISDVFQTVNCWMSEVDIDAGTRWSDKVSEVLEDTNIGIICVTKQNLAAPWLLFEAGALAKSIGESYVIPNARYDIFNDTCILSPIPQYAN